MPYASPEAKRMHNRAYKAAHRERLNAREAERRRVRYATDAEYREKVKAKSLARPAIVSRANRRVFVAIQRGELVRPNVCEECGTGAFTEAAHSDYSKPLEVRWLCRSCHRRWDSVGNGKTDGGAAS